MLVFRALTLTVLGNQGIGPFPDEVRTIANGFLSGYLGNIALGPLGGADLFTLLVALALVGGYVGLGWRNRQGRIGYGQKVEPLAVFALKNALAVVVVMFIAVQLARFKNMPWVLVLLGVLVLGYTLVTNRAVFGRHVYALGGNPLAAKLSISGQVGVVLAVRQHGRARVHRRRGVRRTPQPGGPTAGTNFELDSIAAAFIGGAAVQGGVGKVIGAITGGLIMGVINNGMSLLGAPSERVMLIKGLVLLAAVAFDIWAKRRSGTAR